MERPSLMTGKAGSRASRRSFLVVALAAAGAAGVAAKRSFWNGGPSTDNDGDASAGSALSIRDIPVAVAPHGELAALVPVDDTRDLLLTLLPSWAQSLKVDNIVHAFRLWGPQATFPERVFPRPFPDRETLDGSQMDKLLRDGRYFEIVCPHDPPLLHSFADGTLARTAFSEVPGSTIGALMHLDNLLTAFAELGYPANTPLIALKGDKKPAHRGDFRGEFEQVAIRDMVRGSVSYFDPQQELDWTVEALARYLAPQRVWVNRFGRTFTFDDLVRSIAARPFRQGSCLGTHGPYALTCLWQIDQQKPILSASARQKIVEHLQARSRNLEDSQSALGIYPDLNKGQWPKDRYEDRSQWLCAQQLTYLSHNLEWYAFAPEHLRPKQDTIKRTVEAMLNGLKPWSMYVRSGDYGPLSHAGAALCALLGRRATDIVSD